MKKFRLSAQGLQQTALCAKEHNFTFIAGEHEYHCHSFFADFISPKIAEMHLTDPLADTFYIDLNDDNYEFQKIIDLMQGKTISNVRPSYITKVAKILRNQELFDAFSVKLDYNAEEPDFQGIIAIIDEKHDFGLDYSTEVNFLAQHFHDIPHKLLYGLPLPVMEKILTSKLLLIDSEEEIFNIVCNLIKYNGPEYAHLFSNVIFENLDSKTMSSFIKEFDPSNIDASIWNVIKSRLTLEVQCSIDYSRYKKLVTKIPHNPENPFAGVFDFLFKAKKGLLPKNLVSVFLSNETHIADKFFARDSTSPWHFTEKYDNYLQLDFKSSLIAMTGYEIKMGGSGSSRSSDNFHDWVIEVSDDQTNWEIVDKKERNTDLAPDSSMYFELEKQTPPSRFIRWRITKDPGKSSNNTLNIKQFEIYGDYIEIMYPNEKIENSK
ncbi:protein ubiquitination [Trichomonas vaginalis G3]|nr:protein ubiquitination [Trichomonas vaginalis G3]KAI5499950.1 protein ubiquitination [Trichomonas vaginalis G3]